MRHVAILACLLLLLAPLPGQELLEGILDEDTEKPDDDFLAEDARKEREADLRKLALSVLLRKKLSPDASAAKGPTAKLIVPRNAEYRLWFRYRIEIKKRIPFRVHWRNGGKGGQLLYANFLVEVAGMGAAIEKQLGIHFDAEKDRIGAVTSDAFAWQSQSLNLTEGPLTLQVEPLPATPQAKPLLVDRVFLTASQSYLPTTEEFVKTYLRFRLLQSEPSEAAVSCGIGLTYHILHRDRRNPLGIWYSSAGTCTKDGGAVPFGEYSDWLDLTDCLVNRGGYLTAFLRFRPKLKSFRAELQLAWYPHSSAVLKSVQTSSTAVLLPVVMGPPPAREEPSARMRDLAWLNHFRTAEQVAELHRRWIEEAELPKRQLPKKLRFYTGCWVEVEREQLRELGINTFDGFNRSLDALFYAGSHCPNDPALPENIERHVKRAGRNIPPNRDWRWTLGDEIGSIVGDSHIRMCSDCMRQYHRFIERWGYSAEDFGVESLEDVPFGRLPGAGESRAARLVRFLSNRFRVENSVHFYRTFTRIIEKHHPRVRTSVNYSPHSNLMNGGMRAMDWFALCRANALTHGWGEDWLWGWSWYGFGGPQTESYYAAIVQASVRPHKGMPWGFYLVTNAGHFEQKLMSLLSRQPALIDIYAFGPAYLGAEMSNFWSENKQRYAEIGRALRRICPADDILAEGKQRPARIALLYSRYHEIWQREDAMTYERLLLFYALMHAHLPVDIIIEDDLTPEGLAQYKVLYLTGETLLPGHARAVREWVRSGGFLYAHGGAGSRDHLDSIVHTLDDVFGARQRFVRREHGRYHPNRLPGRSPVDRIRFDDNEFFSRRSIPAIGYKVALSATTGRIIGRYDDGTPAAVVNSFGKGTAMLIGSLPGCAYRFHAGSKAPIVGYRASERDVIAGPALKLIAPPVEASEPLVEVAMIESAAGIAVILNNFKFEPIERLTVSIRTDRTFEAITSSEQGKLKARQTDNGLEISLPLAVGDVICLRTKLPETVQ